MIQLFQPTTDHRERIAIGEVLNSRWIGKGPRVTAFEAAWAKHVGAQPEHMVSTNSCTQALFEAVVLAGLGPGDKAIIPTIHFVGVAQAVLAVGATPVYCDVDPYTLNVRMQDLTQSITRDTKAIIFNHYGGASPEIDRTHIPEHIILIDDLACAPMVNFANLGRCDFATWSTDSMKVVTTGDGGLLWCRRPEHAQNARQDFCLGADSGSGSSSKKPQWWEFFVERYGQGRHLMNDIQAAMGLAQLKKIGGFVERRMELASRYQKNLSGRNEFLYPDNQNSSYYLTCLFTEKRDALAQYLRENDVYTSWRYYPLHLAYKTGTYLPDAQWISEHVLNLPLHASLSDDDVDFVSKKIIEFHEK